MWINLNEDELGLIGNSLYVTKAVVRVYALKADELLTKLAEIRAYACPESDPIFIGKARDMYANDEIEIDDDPALSHADDGVWVGAWLWVSNDDVEACKQCGAIPGTSEYGTVGDGCDGLCPSCADEAEENEGEDEETPEEELARLEAENEAAPGWGAAVGARHERIKRLREQVKSSDD